MKITKHIESEILEVMDDYWSSYFRGDLENWASYLPEHYRNIGTTKEEIWNSKQDIVDYTLRVLDQMVGMAELRDKTTQLIPMDPYIMVHELGDLYVNAEEGWVYYAPLRLSSILEKTEGGWKIIHQHGSFPDSKADEGEAFGFEKLKIENKELRDAIQSRTIELERKNRELEIESALERVRAVAMAMHKPEDILNICEVVFKELRALGFEALRNAIIHVFPENQKHWFDFDYSDTSGGTLASVPYSGNSLLEKFIGKIRKARDSFFEMEVSGKELQDWKDFRKTTEMDDDPRLDHTEALFYYVYSVGEASIGISSFQSISPDQLSLLKRFRNVFDLAYGRYCDIRKAEAQAREAQVEASLERVRSKTMAMHQSEELGEVVASLYKELESLGLSALGFELILFKPENDTLEYWSNPVSLEVANFYKVPRAGHPFFEKQWSAWENKNERLILELFGQEKIDFDNFLFSETEFRDLPEETKEVIRNEASATFSHAFMKYGLLEAIDDKPLSDDEFSVLGRFAKVFEQTYTRFLDLQKAEEQAREAQIEAALERVRAKSMAMQKSEDLADLSLELVQQVQKLGIETWFCAFNIQDDKGGLEWGSNGQGVFPKYRTPREGIFLEYYHAGQSGENLYVREIDEEECPGHYEYLCTLPGVGEQLLKMRDAGIPFPTSQIDHVAFFKYGYILFITFEPVPESHDIFKRFAKVFEQTYTRFLDLQKAEEQAREAQIETALERVRSSSMAMHSSEQLIQVASELRNQLSKLDQEGLETCAIHLYDESPDYFFSWAALQSPDSSSEAVLTQARFPKKGVRSIEEMMNYYHSNEKDYVIVNDEKKFNEFLLMLKQHAPDIQKIVKNTVKDLKKNDIKSYWSVADFKGGSLVMTTMAEPPEHKRAILRRFANVFEQAYIRFLDLKKAEAQAREAQIEAALERVRSRSMAMHNSHELSEVVALMYKQMEPLELAKHGCEIILCNEDKDQLQYWSSNFMQPDLTNRYDIDRRSHPLFGKQWKAWKNQEIRLEVIHTGKVKHDFDEFIFSKTDFQKFPDHVKKWIRSTDADVFTHTTMKYGLLEAVDEAPLSEEKFKVLRRFAKVFEQTYTRFLDLQKAEAQAREAQIEAALERVRARTMAMHKTEDLREVVGVLYEQIRLLHLADEGCNINIFKEDIHAIESWMAAFDDVSFPDCYYIEGTGHPFLKRQWDKWRAQAAPFHISSAGKELEKYSQYIVEETDLKRIPDDIKEMMLAIPELHFSFITFKYGQLEIVNSVEIPSQKNIQILTRFAKVFEQTYTRFLDLQKAEAQAREAQIEAALERVRAASMAMHTSDELSDVLSILCEQYDVLQINPSHAVLTLIDQEKNTMRFRMSGRYGHRVMAEQEVDLKAMDSWVDTNEKWKKSKPNSVNVNEYRAETLPDIWKLYDGILSSIPEHARPRVEDFPNGLFITEGYCRFGYIGFAHNRKPRQEEKEIVVRFAAAFGSLYQRFLDLQKAEAQAREAQIEASLERVRAAAMAMHSSEDFPKVVQVLHTQVDALQVEGFAGAAIILVDESDIVSIWDLTDPSGHGRPQTFRWSFDPRKYPVMGEFWRRWKAGESFFVMESDLQKVEAGLEEVREVSPEFHKALKDAVQRGEYETQWHAFVGFSRGMLEFDFVASPGDDPRFILSKMTGAFDLAYQRYEDLKQAEAQAREAQIEAALERVRSRAMAMHKSDELVEVAILLRKEMGLLGVEELETSSIYIHNDETGKTECWFAIQDREDESNMISDHMIIDLNDTWVGKQMLQFYRSEDLKASILMQGDNRSEWINYCADNCELFSAAFYGDVIPERTYHLFKFNSGYMGAAAPGDISVESWDLLKRATAVFSLAYTRFSDLKNAEAQAREAQIEAALERVRSRAMAMHRSDELAEVIATVYQEVRLLGFDAWGSALITRNETGDGWDMWLSLTEQTVLPEAFPVPNIDDPVQQRFFEAWEQAGSYQVIEFGGREKQTYDRWLFNETNWKDLPEPVKDQLQAAEHISVSIAVMPHSVLETVGTEPLPDDKASILQRFAHVFEQSYTRFLDLKNAEAQAREARIEAALEKVRSRTMGMQKSEELEEVIKVVFDQFIQLDIFVQHTGFLIDYKNRDDMLIWLADENAVFPQVSIPYFDSPHWNSYREAKEKGRDLFTNHLNFEEKNRFYQELFTHIPDLTEETKDYYFQCPGLAVSTVLMDNVGLYIENFEGQPYSDEENSILQRFGKVFQQTYTRFLDLQTAEAQAREALIEAALEKVRSRTMGMQKSEELPQAANLLFQQIQSLGMPAWSAGYCIWKDNKKAITAWMSSEGVLQPPFVAPTTEDELFMEMRKGQEQGKTFHLVEMGGEDLVAHYEYMRTLPVVGEILDSIIDAGHPLPTFQIMHYTYFSHGLLLFITYEPVPEAHPIFKRFAKVFEQTYTRFLDLQTAEAQAREAQIEAALEKVRSRTMAMQKSEELPEVAHELFLQIQSLGIPTWSAGYNILSEDKKSSTCIMSSEGQIQSAFQLPLTGEKSFREWYDAIRKGEPFFVQEIGGKELEEHYQYLFSLPDIQQAIDPIEKAGISFPTYQINHLSFFQHGFLLFITYEKVPEAHDIFKRFTLVFEQTYTRFLDLKKAEAQAREAQIEAALEKVRSSSLAVTKVDEFNDVVLVAFQKLSEFELPVSSLCIATAVEGSKDFEVFGCGESESGLMTLKFKLPYFQNAFIDDLLRERSKSTVGYFSKVYTEEEKNVYYKYALNNTELQHLPDDIKQQIHNSKAYGLSTAFARLSMIMVNDMEGNILDESQAEIVQRFSTVFEQAYIRFLDLQKAEAQAREAEIEAALERLRAASMAMRHSEELTATASVMFEELVKLGLKPWSFAFMIFRDTTDVADCWSSDQLGASATLVLPHKPDPFLKKSYNDWKNKESLTVMEAKGAALRKHQQYMKSIPEFEKILKKRRSAGIKVLDKMIFHKAHFRYGYIMINTSEPQPEYWEIFKRFAKVFEQTYTRFLDLQKAEAQAREAQIEASLERVRARTMAMHKSDELTDTATEMYKQLMTLGLQPWNFAFIIFRDNSDVAECWSSDQTGALPKIVLPHKPEKFLNKTFEEWKKGESLTITHAKGAALKKHQVYMKSISGFDQIVKQRKKAGLDLPKQMIFHNAHFEYGYLMINTLEPQPEYLDIFKRFAKVFEQTYTRFLDLKNAEEQAAITEKQNRDLAQSYKDLQETQAQLVQAEKMASLGELTAGIAHEIQNPLNFVNNFSEVSNELLEEMEEELDQGNMEDVKEIINDLKQNLGKIHHHGGRADSIVKGMLQHSRTSSGEKEPTDINELADEYLRLAYHGLRAKDPKFNAAMETHFNTSIGKIKVIPQDIGRVLLNLITNAFQAVHEKTMSMSEGSPSLDPVPERPEEAGGKGGNVSDNSQRAPSIPEGTTSHSACYQPKITLSTLHLHDSSTLQITIQDNGPGIPDSIKDKIFQPFFTTKPTGQGTGLGLSLAYDIVKAHGGEIMVESAKDKGTTFIVELPIV